MRSRTWLVVLLLGGLLVLPPASAQQELELSLDPPKGEVVLGGNTTRTDLVLVSRELTPVVVRLSFSGDANVILASEEVYLLPNAAQRVAATLSPRPGASPGERLISFFANDTGPSGGNATATYTLTIREPPANKSSPLPTNQTPEGRPEPLPMPDPVAPELDPPDARASLPPGGEKTLAIQVRNPAQHAQRYQVSALLPEGWEARVEPEEISLEAGASSTLHVHLRATLGAAEGSGSVRVANRTAEAFVSLALQVETPPDAEPDPSSPRTPTPPADEPEEPDDSPPPAPESEPGPGPSPVPEEPEPELPPTQPTAASLQVDPEEIVLAPGRTSLATLLVKAPLDREISGRIELDLPLGIEGLLIPGPDVELSPGEGVQLTLSLRATSAPPGKHPARATFEDAQAPFLLDLLDVAPLTMQEGGEGPPADVRHGVVLLTAAVGTSAVVVAFLHRRWPLLAILYARLAPGRLLDHPVRRRLAALVAQQPGIHVGELQRSLGLSYGALVHHARSLERARLLVATRDGQQRRFWPPGTPRPPPRGGLDEQVLDLVAQEGPLAATDLARRLGVSRQALHYHLKQLGRDGHLVTHRQGRSLLVDLPGTRVDEEDMGGRPAGPGC